MYGTKVTPRFENSKLVAETPAGSFEIPGWEENELIQLGEYELLEKALTEHYDFCISPATYAMLEKKFLTRILQHLLNPNMGMRHVNSNFYVLSLNLITQTK